MKKLLLSLFAMCTTAMIGHAEKMAFQAAGATSGNTSSATTICTISGSDITQVPFTQDGICSFKITKKNSNTSNVDADNGLVKWYANDIITLTPASDVTINTITIHCCGSSSKYYGQITIGETSITTSTSAPDATFENLNATSEISISNSNQIRFSYLEIDYTKTESTTCSTPVFDPKSGTELYEQEKVWISTYTEGAEIYYTIGGIEPSVGSDDTHVYNAATGIALGANGDGVYTIKAIATKEGLDNSAVATASYTYKAVRPEVVKWDMVTAATTLTDGIYIIANGTDGACKALGKDYNSDKKNNFKAVDVTIEEGKLLDPSDEVALVYLRKNSDGNWTLEVTNATTDPGANFLASASSSSNNMKMNDKQTPATITISETDNAADIKFTGSYTRNWIRYNGGSTIFSCYGSGQQPVYLFKQPVEKPVTPDATVDGATTIANEGTIELKGSAKTITFEGLAEGVNIWYKFTAAIAPQAEYTPEAGYSEYVAATGISLTQAGTLTYYAEKDGVVGDTHTITVTGTTVGINEIEAEGVATEWFDLSGRRVAAPAKGVYLRKQGAKVTKIAY